MPKTGLDGLLRPEDSVLALVTVGRKIAFVQVRREAAIGQFPGGPFGGWEMKWSNGNAAVNGLAELRKTRLCDFS